MEPKKRPISKHGKQKWEVDFGYDEYGNRPRPVFKTEQEADDAIDAYHKDVKKAGDFWTRLTPSERKETAGVLE